MKIGVLIKLNSLGEIDERFAKVAELGFGSCQLNCWDPELFTPETAKAVNEAKTRHGVEISTFWCGWSGPKVWDFYEGPITLGLVPPAYRFERMRELAAGSDFAKMIGVNNIATHVGFLPENPASAEYHGVIAALKTVANHCKKNGQFFLFETGQETPVTLRRTMEDVGTDNLGVNLDPANLILYGKANPVDAAEILGKYVRDVHAKDGCYPTDGRHLGKETPLTQGSVNFPALIAALKKAGYDGPLTIEREISGEQQTKDILMAKKVLEELIETV